MIYLTSYKEVVGSCKEFFNFAGQDYAYEAH